MIHDGQLRPPGGWTATAMRLALGAVMLLAFLPATVGAAEESTADFGELLRLPLANRSGSSLAAGPTDSTLQRSLEEHFVQVRSPEELRPLLRRHRIRSLGRIGRRGARILHEQTRARFALVGAYEVYANTQSREVGMALRLLDLDDSSLAAAAVAGATWQDTERSFGRRSAADQTGIGVEVAEELVDRLVDQARRNRSRPAHKSDLVAIVQLNDHSGNGAESVVESALLASLLEAGFPVVEPGFVRELQLDHGLGQRGGVSRELAGRLHEDLGVRWVLTGGVDRFDLAGSDTQEAIPRAEWGLRLIDARSGRLVAALDLDQSGTDGDTLLGRGRIHSGIDLIRDATQKQVLPWLEKEVRP